MDDKRLELPESNMFRYWTGKPAKMPDSTAIPELITFRTASEIENERKSRKQNV